MKTNRQSIKNIMNTKGITLETLAVKMSLVSPQAAYYRLYNAKKLSTIKAVAKALGAGVRDIILR